MIGQSAKREDKRSLVIGSVFKVKETEGEEPISIRLKAKGLDVSECGDVELQDGIPISISGEISFKIGNKGMLTIYAEELVIKSMPDIKEY